MSMNYKKLPVVLVILLVGFLLSISPLYAGTIFQNFNNNSYNTNYFFLQMSQTPGAPTVTVTNGRLEVTFPASTITLAAAGLGNLANHRLVGDYDIQVDFDLLTWPSDNWVWPGIVTQLYDMVRINHNEGQGTQDAYLLFFFAEQVPGQPTVGHLVTAADNSGKMRLNRTGNTVSGYYWHNNAWQSIGSYTDPQYGAPIDFSIGGTVGNRATDSTVKVAFDNLKVTNASFKGNSIPPFMNLLMN